MPENRQGRRNGTVLATASACGGTRHSAGSGPRCMGRTGMGLTIVHKSDLATRKKNPRVALVLAGGAVTGGAYKLGGLKALDDFLVNRKTTDFDIYVGLSAGAFLAAPLAGGVTPPEMLRSLDGTSEDFTYLSPLDFYNPNLAEFAQKPLEFLVDLLTYVPSALYDFLAQTPELVRSLQEPLAQARRRPTLANLIECVKPVIDAVGAARALPGFYQPARLKGVGYVDGAVRRTANVDVASEHGAELVICYNPFRPFHNRVVRRFLPEKGRYEIEGRPLASQGMLTVLNQVLRTLLHSRLQLGIQQYQDDPSFQGDIILLEPGETDLAFFKMAPLNLWAGRSAGAHGYLSVTQAIEAHYEMIRQILQTYGVLMTRKEVREGLERLLRNEPSDGPEDVLLRDVPKRNLHLAFPARQRAYHEPEG